MVVFVTLPDGARYAFVGDLAWRLEAILEREQRPWFVCRSGREDPTALGESVLSVNAIATRFPAFARRRGYTTTLAIGPRALESTQALDETSLHTSRHTLARRVKAVAQHDDLAKETAHALNRR